MAIPASRIALALKGNKGATLPVPPVTLGTPSDRGPTQVPPIRKGAMNAKQRQLLNQRPVYAASYS